MLTLDRISKIPRRQPDPPRVTLAVPAGCAHRRRRPERGRQVDAAQESLAGLDEPDAGRSRGRPPGADGRLHRAGARRRAPQSGGEAPGRALDRRPPRTTTTCSSSTSRRTTSISPASRASSASLAALPASSSSSRTTARSSTASSRASSSSTSGREGDGSTPAAGATTRPSASARATSSTRAGRSVEERRRIEEQAARMAEWERRGYGQGRKKKRSKDVKQGIRREGSSASRPSRSRTSRGSSSSRSRRAARSGDVVARLEGAVVERGSFRLGPLDLGVGWGDRVAIAGPNGSGKTTLLDALLGKLPLAAGTRWVGPGSHTRRARPGAGRFAGPESLLDTFCPRRRPQRRGPNAPRQVRARRRRRRCVSAGSLSPGRAHTAGSWRSSPCAASTACSSTSRPTTSTSRRSRSSSARSERYDGTVLLVTHDRRFLERFAATRTVQLE